MLQIITENHLLKEIIVNAVREAVEEIRNHSSHHPVIEAEERLNRKELAKYLDCTLPTVDRYRSTGVIPFYQTGRTIYFKKLEVDEALKVGGNKRRAKKW